MGVINRVISDNPDDAPPADAANERRSEDVRSQSPFSMDYRTDEYDVNVEAVQDVAGTIALVANLL